MSSKKVMVDGVEYVASEAPAQGDLTICVLQRGYILIGNLTIDGEMCTLTNAQCIRVWGTERGLGQIAAEGPTSKTKLDPQPATRFHILTSVQFIVADASKW